MADSRRDQREAEELRRELVELDAQLLATLDKRALTARRIGELRSSQAPAPSLPLADHASIRALVARSSGHMPPDALRVILREVFAACLALELPSNVAFVGVEGAAGHAAARGRFGSTTRFVAADDTAAALDAIVRKKADFAVVPFETLSEGPVQATVLGLVASDLRVAEILDASFDLHLMSETGDLASNATIFATAVDRALCRRALAALGAGDAGPVLVETPTPAEACRRAKETAGSAALVGEAFGAQSGLEVARRSVTDQGATRARYAVVSARPSGRTGDDVTSLVFSVQDAPGSLLDVLKVLADRGINLMNIQSYPARGETWSYLFYAETKGHFTDRPLVMAFEEMKRIARFFKLLGSYPTP